MPVVGRIYEKNISLAIHDEMENFSRKFLGFYNADFSKLVFIVHVIKIHNLFYCQNVCLYL